MNLAEIKTGDPVCVLGSGAATGVHAHSTVDRVTKTMIVVTYSRKGHPALQRRYRFSGREVGASDYSSTELSRKCQLKTS